MPVNHLIGQCGNAPSGSLIAARKAAHKLAKVTDADRAAYTHYREAMARPGRVRCGPLVQHARCLRRLFGTANVEKARAVFEARWNERFAELHAAA